MTFFLRRACAPPGQATMRGFIQFSHYKEVPTKPGIYKVCLRKSFPRLSGKRTNVVYIGMASGRDGLRGRTKSFFTKSGSGRKAASRFRELQGRTGAQFLYFYRVCADPRAVREGEEKELVSYKKRFWEVPPLNHGE